MLARGISGSNKKNWLGPHHWDRARNIGGKGERERGMNLYWLGFQNLGSNATNFDNESEIERSPVVKVTHQRGT